uniref:Uncharacterized protein n=1 Tax=Oryzias melastigma TaxID=30732 RepID=A0A3B3CDQ4_ORYME
DTQPCRNPIECRDVIPIKNVDRCPAPYFHQSKYNRKSPHQTMPPTCPFDIKLIDINLILIDLYGRFFQLYFDCFRTDLLSLWFVCVF